MADRLGIVEESFWVRTLRAWHVVFWVLWTVTLASTFLSTELTGGRRIAVLTDFFLLGVAYGFIGGPAVTSRRRAPAHLYRVILIAAVGIGVALHPQTVFLMFLAAPQIWVLTERIREGAAYSVALVTAVGTGQVWGAGWSVAAFWDVLPWSLISLVISMLFGIWVERVIAESEQRAALIEQLEAARGELAQAHHTAGVMAERERVAREIHDTLAQGLTSIIMLTQTATAELHRTTAGTGGDPAGTRGASGTGSPSGGSGTASGGSGTASDGSGGDSGGSRGAAGSGGGTPGVEGAAGVAWGGGGSGEGVVGRLAAIEATARENLAEARALVAAFTPVALSGATLTEVLRRQAERFAAETGVAVQVSLDLPDKEAAALPQAQQVVLLRAAQEALANIRKHAQATQVRISLAPAGDGVGVEILDDGAGFATTEPATGYGLAAMRGRVEESGGTVQVDSEPGRGTRVQVLMPAAAQEER